MTKDDLISRQAAIDATSEIVFVEYEDDDSRKEESIILQTKAAIRDRIKALPPVYVPEINVGDMISRQMAIDLLKQMRKDGDMVPWEGKDVFARIRKLPSSQPERTCVNCGRTANNGGWYADGRTRCPIEEHYALPKDGFCHLWEKRNVTDDDYPERQEVDGERRTDE